MDEKGRRWRPGRGGCGCLSGCGSFVFVFLLGGALSLFSSVFGLGVSIGIPFTQNNVTVADQNFINQSTTLTVGPAEGAGLFIVGSQTGAPAIDLYIVLR